MSLVKRAIDGLERRCFFSMESAAYKYKFMQQLNNSFGSGGMSLALNEAQFSCFIQFIKNECMGTLPIKKAATIVGMQQHSDELRYVLGPEIELDVEGKVVKDDDRIYVWLEGILMDKVPPSIELDEVWPTIKLPINSLILANLLRANEGMLPA
ncbi:PREDICTED: uncharacterized protein LOC109591165 [Amphimedon queenslandica]|uniref:Uncharacterized protein n=2 Tax=Amphimedon queenslandica TaxID=400682 RepID=A0AAN0JZH5_AMPQE|nr:PREDICTED: uncharacterized protein LOC109591165 [Amphimedon queenslandica]XP_019862514.1 PREDICTED: uncharacterized protein LOC109591165 [Amphimedon queenslandica]|eukprot:XP_019862513.1 PREDICTED: uncharacterized protein LOC109591165 [Amphimedon queenslandica]